MKNRMYTISLVSLLILILITTCIAALKINKWEGKKIVTFGDSITWYDGHEFVGSHIETGNIAKGYQYYMRSKLKCTVINEGMDGKTMPEIWADKIKSYDFSDVDAVTITSGANDYKNLTELGMIDGIGSKHDESTFYGALQSSIEKIKFDNTRTKIYLLTPIKGWFNEEGTESVPNPEAKGLMGTDYVNAIKEIGKLYKTPVCDWYSETGFNEKNRAKYYGETDKSPYYLHPTNAGFKRMADILIPFLKKN